MITFVFQLGNNIFAVSLAADLAGYVDVRLIGVKSRTEPVVLDRKNVCTESGNVVEQSAEAARLIEQRYGEFQSAVS